MEKIPMTQAGYTRLEKELKNLKSVERPAIIEAIAEARAHGDLSENAEYAAAKEKQSFIEGRIKELEAVISRADIIDVKALTGETIKFGATVKLVDEETEEELRYVDVVVEIPVWGLPYAYNVATSAALALYEYCKQWPAG